MTLAQLKYAITVANANSMNEAARTLFISQPSLSAAIRDLEEEVGVELFHRTNRGISLTPDGEEFIGYARQVVEQYQLIESRYIAKEKINSRCLDFFCRSIRFFGAVYHSEIDYVYVIFFNLAYKILVITAYFFV